MPVNQLIGVCKGGGVQESQNPNFKWGQISNPARQRCPIGILGHWFHQFSTFAGIARIEYTSFFKSGYRDIGPPVQGPILMLSSWHTTLT